MSEETNHVNPCSPPADGVAALWRRLKEHRIAQWSVGYVAVAYGIQHAVTLTSEAYDWPNTVVRISMTLLALGLPIAMTLAWYHGERATHRVSAGEFAIISLLLAMGAFLFYVFVRPEPAPTAPVAVAAKMASVAVPAKAPPPLVPMPSGPSVAVLPFLNLSGDPKEEYFSDGMTEEITSALAKIPNLPVVGRTSAFAFKGKNEDLRVMGQQLGAAYLLEGSVRKAGDRVRITAQLIKAETGDHIWTDSYDRNLTDIFAVQEDVARAIAAALQVPLGLKQGETLVSNRTSDTQSYEDYLKALALYRARNIKDVIALLEPMVKRDPGYAPAWAVLADAYSVEPYYYGLLGTVDEIHGQFDLAMAKAEMAARQATRLDAKYAPGYAALAFLETNQGKWVEADSDFQKAMALDPTDPDTFHLWALTLASEGRLKEALKTRTTLRALEPFVPVYNVYLALTMQLNGDVKDAISILEGLSPEGPVGAQRDNYLALAYAAEGQFEPAAKTLIAISPNMATWPLPLAKEAADILLKAPAAVNASQPTPVSPSEFGWAYAFVGAQQRVLDEAERVTAAGIHSQPNTFLVWHPIYAPVRKTERFKTLVRKMGLVDYWRARGWPDLCHPVGADDFACN